VLEGIQNSQDPLWRDAAALELRAITPETQTGQLSSGQPANQP
jgi:hypothetical protein